MSKKRDRVHRIASGGGYHDEANDSGFKECKDRSED